MSVINTQIAPHRSLSRQLMARILDPQGGTSLYDPTCGSGGMLNQGNEHALQHGGPRLRL